MMSRQDISSYTERNKSTGLQLPYTFCGSFSGAANFGSGKGDGSFASVVEQASIFAGGDGYQVNGPQRLLDYRCRFPRVEPVLLSPDLDALVQSSNVDGER